MTFADPVSEFGFNVEDYATGQTTFTFTVLGGGGTVLGTFTTVGDDPGGISAGVAGSLAFVGAQATDGTEITAVTVTDDTSNNIAVGPVSFANASPTSPSVTPEPGTLWLAGTAFAGAGFVRRLRRGR